MASDRTPDSIAGPVFSGGAFIEDGFVAVENGRVVDAGPRHGRAADLVLDGDRLIPGLIDIHVHGAGGSDVMNGVEAIVAVARTLARHGVTAFLPTAVSAPRDRLEAFVQDVGEVRRRQALAPVGELGSAVLGANLEGPAIDPGHRGAHDPAALVTPAEFLRWWDSDPATWKEVRIVTVAPERPAGMELVRRLVAQGRIASVGHTGATYAEAVAAFDEGAASTTHLFNGMTGVHHRQPGVALAALLHERARVELIADGVHVDPAVQVLTRRLVGRDRVILVSDAIPAAGMGDGEYELGGLRVQVRDGRASLEDGTIAGSTLTLDQTVRRAIAAGFPATEAVAAATVNPASLLGLGANGRIGPAANADLLVVGASWEVRRVMLGGRWVG